MNDAAKALTPFHEWVEGHARGTLDDELTAAMAEVTQAVTSLNEKGQVVVKITITPAGSGGRTVSVAGVVEAKPPTPAPEVSIFYADGDGGLHRDDPYQTRIGVDPETGEVIP